MMKLLIGLRKASVGPTIIITVMLVRYLILPVIGIGVIKMAANMGLVPVDPLFRFVLLIMFALPPGVNISKPKYVGNSNVLYNYLLKN